MMKEITVVMPVYKVEKYVSETIDSYIVTAEGKMREYGYGTLSLVKA